MKILSRTKVDKFKSSIAVLGFLAGKIHCLARSTNPLTQL